MRVEKSVKCVKIVKCGFRQGSVLGPSVFHILTYSVPMII